MKLLLLGADGQLGREVKPRAAERGWEIAEPLLAELDISDRDALRRYVADLRPELIVNCAAYTNVDKAESEKELAFRVNADGAGNLAEAASDSGARLVHVSTDFVFDGQTGRLLDEAAPPRPLSVYGASKLRGEELIQARTSCNSLIVRTSSLHGAKGPNFVHSMIRLFAEKTELKIINDRYMSPTWAGFLAEVLLELGLQPCSGVVHASCAGALSWYDFAAEIKRIIAPKLPAAEKVSLIPVSSADFPLPAARPAFSAFNLGRLASLLGREPIDWRQGLRCHLGELGYV